MTTPTSSIPPPSGADQAAHWHAAQAASQASSSGPVSLMIETRARSTQVVELLSVMECERTTALLDDLDETGIELEPTLAGSEPMLHCFALAVRAAQRTRQREKARLFARLLASAARHTEPCISSVDEFEELLGIGDDLSFREIRILAILERFERATSCFDLGPGELGDDRSATRRFWPCFLLEVRESTGVRYNELGSVLIYLARTGLYRSYGDVGDRVDECRGGRLTPRYYRLRDLITDTGGNIIGASLSA